MIKVLELSDPNSCLNKARKDELVFVLLGRDTAAPFAIRQWATERVLSGKNKWTDAQIIEAMETADAMERNRTK